jgi:hypothetical protein
MHERIPRDAVFDRLAKPIRLADFAGASEFTIAGNWRVIDSDSASEEH